VDDKTSIDFVLKDAGHRTAAKKKKRVGKGAGPAKVARKSRRKPQRGPDEQGGQAEDDVQNDPVENALRAWRLAEAKRKNIPAFRIFGDRVLKGIASVCPTTDAELLSVPGIGMAIVKKYGPQIFKLVSSSQA
jgi:DNA topoisomerase-3